MVTFSLWFNELGVILSAQREESETSFEGELEKSVFLF